MHYKIAVFFAGSVSCHVRRCGFSSAQENGTKLNFDKGKSHNPRTLADETKSSLNLRLSIIYLVRNWMEGIVVLKTIIFIREFEFQPFSSLFLNFSRCFWDTFSLKPPNFPM